MEKKENIENIDIYLKIADEVEAQKNGELDLSNENPELINKLNSLNEVNPDLTDDFDYTKEKQAQPSTVSKYINTIEKRMGLKYGRTVVSFDYLKLATPLDKFNKDEFTLYGKHMVECDTPSKYSFLDADNSQEDFEEVTEDDLYNEDEMEDLKAMFRDEGEDSREKTANTTQNDSCFLLKNYQISKEIRERNLGIQNIYISNNVLYTAISGKFMASNGDLGRINRDNVLDCFNKLNNLGLFSFIDTFKFYSETFVYICHECIDVPVGRAQKEKMIRAISSFFPVASNNCTIHKYRNNSLTLKRKTNNKIYLTIYDKHKELMNNKKSSNQLYRYIIGADGIEASKNIIRVETKFTSLEAMRTMFVIPHKQKKVVLLSDLIDSTSRCALTMFEWFNATEEKLLDKFRYYKDIKQTKKLTNTELNNLLAQHQVCNMLKESNDLMQVRDTLIIEYGIENENLIDSLITKIKDQYFNYVMFNKPKSAKLVMDMLHLIAKCYGREE